MRTRARTDPRGLEQDLAFALGTKADPDRIRALVADLASGALSFADAVVFVDDGTLGAGRRGAFAAGEGGSPGTIYLERSLLSDASALEAVFLEEAGHLLDAAHGGEDAAGDEGALFALASADGVLGARQVEALRGEDDGGVIVVDGRGVEVEFNEEDGGGGGDESGGGGSTDGASGGGGGAEASGGMDGGGGGGDAGGGDAGGRADGLGTDGIGDTGAAETRGGEDGGEDEGGVGEARSGDRGDVGTDADADADGGANGGVEAGGTDGSGGIDGGPEAQEDGGTGGEPARTGATGGRRDGPGTGGIGDGGEPDGSDPGGGDAAVAGAQGVAGLGAREGIGAERARGSYKSAVAGLDPDDSDGRRAAKAAARAGTPPVTRAAIEAARPDLGPRAGSGGTANRSNPGVNRAASRLGVMGRISGVFGAVLGVGRVATADDKPREAARVAGGTLGGIGGGAAAGAALGAMGANPVTIGVGAFVGAVAGGIVGEEAVNRAISSWRN